MSQTSFKAPIPHIEQPSEELPRRNRDVTYFEIDNLSQADQAGQEINSASATPALEADNLSASQQKKDDKRNIALGRGALLKINKELRKIVGRAPVVDYIDPPESLMRPANRIDPSGPGRKPPAHRAPGLNIRLGMPGWGKHASKSGPGRHRQ